MMPWWEPLIMLFIAVVAFCGFFEIPRRWFQPKRTDEHKGEDA